MEGDSKIREYLTAMYGVEQADGVCRALEARIEAMPRPERPQRYLFGPADAVLITYGHSLNRKGEAPLKTLKGFCLRYLADAFNTIHILPFFPFSSDDGFSVIDYTQVDPSLGTWEDVEALGREFRLMCDFVVNHVSAQSPWVQNYLKGEGAFADLAIAVAPDTDLSGVVRPRALPLLTPFQQGDGQAVWLWTTFSADQVDLNWANPAVLLRMVDVMLDYVHRGAAILRLDAIAYLWKALGTDCIHRPETHLMVKLLRAILDRVAPQVVLLTETNVPHDENISYFGDGRDEAQWVYNFTLPPLLLYTLAEADSKVLSEWAASLKPPSRETTYLNFTASHDGIGVRPLEGVLPDAAIDRLVGRTLANGGRVSMRDGAGGRKAPYELNITYIDALGEPGKAEDPLLGARFLATQSIQFALPGVPATYLPSMLGSRNWQEGVEQSSQPRRINRQPLDCEQVVRELAHGQGFRRQVFEGYRRMVSVRRRQPAFGPGAAADVLDLGPSVFAIRRRSAFQTIWALTNISARRQTVRLDQAPRRLVDLMDAVHLSRDQISLGPYQSRWLSDQGGAAQPRQRG